MMICMDVTLICLAIAILIFTVGLVGIILIKIKDYIKEKFFK